MTQEKGKQGSAQTKMKTLTLAARVQKSTATCPDSETQLSTEKWLRFPPWQKPAQHFLHIPRGSAERLLCHQVYHKALTGGARCRRQAGRALRASAARRPSARRSLHAKYPSPTPRGIPAPGRPRCCELSPRSGLLLRKLPLRLGRTEKLA